MFKPDYCISCKNTMTPYDDIYFVCNKCRMACLQSEACTPKLIDYLDQVSKRMQGDQYNLHNIQQKKLSNLTLSEEEKRTADHCTRFNQIAHDLKLMMHFDADKQYRTRLYDLIELKREVGGETYYG